MEPKLKRKKGSHYRREPSDALPVSSIQSGCSQQYKGYFTGINVRILEKEHINSLYRNGCFGISSITKAAPMTLWKNRNPARITQAIYDKKIEWRETFGIQDCQMNVDPIHNEVEIISDVESINENLPIVETSDLMDDNNDDSAVVVKNLLVDPFPIEESLMLFSEEAFFLHYTLKCLEVVDKEGNQLMAEQLFQKFTSINSDFIRNFVAYQYLRSKNWIVKSGLKFGGNFCKLL